jgi:hypothetical protein
MSRLCWSTETLSAKPCLNLVDDGRSLCAAGHETTAPGIAVAASRKMGLVAGPGAPFDPDELMNLEHSPDGPLAKACLIAAAAHGGQPEPTGGPYTDHLNRVTALVAHHKNPTLSAVAMLHDVLEDTSLTYGQLRQVMGPEIADAVQILSRPAGVSYADFIDTIVESGNWLATTTKDADVDDHLRGDEESKALFIEKPSLKRRYLRAQPKLKAALLAFSAAA